MKTSSKMVWLWYISSSGSSSFVRLEVFLLSRSTSTSPATSPKTSFIFHSRKNRPNFLAFVCLAVAWRAPSLSSWRDTAQAITGLVEWVFHESLTPGEHFFGSYGNGEATTQNKTKRSAFPFSVDICLRFFSPWLRYRVFWVFGCCLLLIFYWVLFWFR